MRERSETIKGLKDKLSKLIVLIVTAKYGSFSAYAKTHNVKQMAPTRMSLERVLNIAENVGIEINITLDYEKAVSEAVEGGTKE